MMFSAKDGYDGRQLSDAAFSATFLIVIGCLMHFARLANKLLKDEESARDNHIFACNFAKYSPILIFLLSDSPINLCLLATPPHLKYAATCPCNLSLIGCFADINVSQGSVATHARCGGMFNIRLTANLLRNLPASKFCKSVKI